MARRSRLGEAAAITPTAAQQGQGLALRDRAAHWRTSLVSKVTKLPTTFKAPPPNRLRALNEFARDADYIVDRYDELNRIDDPVARVALISEQDREVLARCDQGF